jgi:hypothetical protein
MVLITLLPHPPLEVYDSIRDKITELDLQRIAANLRETRALRQFSGLDAKSSAFSCPRRFFFSGTSFLPLTQHVHPRRASQREKSMWHGEYVSISRHCSEAARLMVCVQKQDDLRCPEDRDAPWSLTFPLLRCAAFYPLLRADCQAKQIRRGAWPAESHHHRAERRTIRASQGAVCYFAYDFSWPLSHFYVDPRSSQPSKKS